jgi:hypothetical protein
MKKLLVLMILVLVPMVTFADFQIGPTALYNMRFTNPEQVDTSTLSLDDFTFGADARLNVSILQGSAYALLTLGSVDNSTAIPKYVPTTVDLFFDVGVCLDIMFFRFGAGIGPNFAILFPDPLDTTNTDIFGVGANVKFSADVMLGSIAIGLVYFMDTNLTTSAVVETIASKWDGHLGLSLLFKLM